MEKAENILKTNGNFEKGPELKKQVSGGIGKEMTEKEKEVTEIKRENGKEKGKIKVAKKLKMKNEGSRFEPWIYYILALPFLIVLIVGIFFSWKQLKNFSHEVEVKRAQLAALEDWNAGVSELSQRLLVLEKEIEVIDHALPNEAGIVDFVDQFSIATEEAVLRTFRFEGDAPKVDKSGNNYINFQFEIAGNFDNLLDFTDKIIHLPYLISLKQVEIKKEEEVVSFVVVGRIYVAEPFFLTDTGVKNDKKI